MGVFRVKEFIQGVAPIGKSLKNDQSRLKKLENTVCE
jgi:hypothetical protein